MPRDGERGVQRWSVIVTLMLALVSITVPTTAVGEENFRSGLYCGVDSICKQDVAFVLPDRNELWYVAKTSQPHQQICATISTFHYTPPIINQCQGKSAPLNDSQILFSTPISTVQKHRLYQARYYSFPVMEEKIVRSKRKSVDSSRPKDTSRNSEFYTMPFPFASSLSSDDASFKDYMREVPISSPVYGSITSLPPMIHFENMEGNPDTIERVDVSINSVLERVSIPIKNFRPNYVGLNIEGMAVEPSSWFITVVPTISYPKRVALDQAPVSKPKRRGLIQIVNDGESKSQVSSQESLISMQGIPTYLYLELVLSDEQILQERRFVPPSTYSGNPLSGANDFSLLPSSFSSDLRKHFKERKFISSSVEPQRVTVFKQFHPNSLPPKTPGRSRVCISGGIKMDGQRRIWVDQLKYFAEISESRSLSFEFAYLFTTADDETINEEEEFNADWFDKVSMDPAKALFYMKLVPGLLLVKSPNLELSPRFFSQKPKVVSSSIYSADYNKPASEFLKGDEGNQSKLFDYIHHRFLLAKKRITPEHLTPRWVYNLYYTFFEFWTFINCDMIVVGNPRGLTGDFFLVDIASVMHVPTLAELVNLYMHPYLTPDVIIAPSHYALEHWSTRDVLKAKKGQSKIKRNGDHVGALGIVVPPSVDMQAFQPQRFAKALYRDYREQVHLMRNYIHANPAKHYYPTQQVSVDGIVEVDFSSQVSEPKEKNQNLIQIRRPKQCPAIDYFVNETTDYFALIDQHQTWKHFPCVLIGFVGRLHPSKNSAMFLQIAYYIHHHHFPFARFRIIGDGPLREDMEHLARRLRLEDVVEFVGWIPIEQLPHELVQLDIVINPSIRAWSETFCIANVEALAMAVPLVTLGVGGIGEYIRPPLEDKEEVRNSTTVRKWSVTENALLVHTADPMVIAQAVHVELLQQPRAAQRLGKQGRESVVNYFTPARQMQQYEQLYRVVHENRYVE